MFGEWISWTCRRVVLCMCKCVCVGGGGGSESRWGQGES